LTARSEQGDIVEGFNKGTADYLTKPFNTTDPVARVRLHISLREARQQAAWASSELARKDEKLAALKQKKCDAFAEIQLLQSMLAICAKCWKVRDDAKCRQQIEDYFRGHSDTDLTHATCQACSRQS